MKLQYYTLPYKCNNCYLKTRLNADEIPVSHEVEFVSCTNASRYIKAKMENSSTCLTLSITYSNTLKAEKRVSYS